MKTCINCKKGYKDYMLHNFNLSLCKKCYDKFDKKEIQRNDFVDEVTHKITCPKCKKVYDIDILEKKCKTKDCNVWFFWDCLDCFVFAKWVNL